MQLAELPLGYVRGVLIEGTTLRGIITAGAELPVTPANVPYIEVISKNSADGFATVQAGETITVVATGFEMSADDVTTVTILIAGEVVADDVKVTEIGAFRQQVCVPYLSAGDHAVEVRQQVGKRLSLDRTTILVVADDDF